MIRRLAVVSLTLLVSTFAVYVLVALAGDPRAELYADRSPGRAGRIAARTQAMHLDVPLPRRYLGWLGRAGGCVLPHRACDLGRNADGQQVVDLLRPALAATVRLVLVAAVLSVLLGVAAGTVSALRRNHPVDRVTTFAAVLFLSLPAVWVAVLLKEYLAIGVNDWLVAHPSVIGSADAAGSAAVPVAAALLGTGAVVAGMRRRRVLLSCLVTVGAAGLWIVTAGLLGALPGYLRQVHGRLLPTIGSGTPGFTGDPWQRFLDAATHLALPTLVMMLVSFATYARFTRAGLLEVLPADYLRTARAKGLSESAVVIRHGLRNALIPVVTVAAIDAGALVGGAVVTENVFGRPGMGTLLVAGLALPDPDVVMACYLVTAAGVAAFTVLGDMLYACLDPRVRP